MAQFFGLHTRNVDDKGRITIPTSFRNDLGEGNFLIVFGSGEYLTVYTSEDWGQYFNKLQVDDTKENVKQLDELRDIAVTVQQVKFDAQGRVSIPDQHRKHAGIAENDEVTVLGLGNRIEIWRTDKLKAKNEAGK